MSLPAGNGADVVHAAELEGRRDHSTADVFDDRDAETIVILGAVATF